jgi:hypothetical protein
VNNHRIIRQIPMPLAVFPAVAVEIRAMERAAATTLDKPVNAFAFGNTGTYEKSNSNFVYHCCSPLSCQIEPSGTLRNQRIKNP